MNRQLQYLFNCLLLSMSRLFIHTLERHLFIYSNLIEHAHIHTCYKIYDEEDDEDENEL